MNPNNNKPSFMDRGTLLAFILILGFWFAWSKYMQTNYPQPKPAENAAATSANPGATTNAANTTAPAANAAAASTVPASGEETFTDFSDDTWSFQISSKGMGLRNIDIKSYKTRTDEPIVLAKVVGDYPFATALLGAATPVDFKIEKQNETTFVGHANVDGTVIEKTMVVNSAQHTVNVTVNVSQVGQAFTGLATTLSDMIPNDPPKGFLSGGNYDHQDWFVYHEGSKTRETVHKDKGMNLGVANVSVAALTEHYFAIAIVDHSDLMPRFESTLPIGADKVMGRLVYQPTIKPASFTQKYVAFAGPKSFSMLSSIDENLARVVDYGMFAVIAKPILWLLKYLYSLIGNWGWAIIVLTIIVRLIVMPFNIFSYKSMKVMQRIQPEMNRIRERYKDKPADQKLQMNQEIMELMKRNKANPLGGCLPMLIQLPVFLALYQVLGQSIELYRAPFMLWIHDLSVRDPYFVLPVLMGITMFVNQKITPTNMDPQQAKIMMWMPVIFSLFMLSLPSGLTLYIFISTLFGILQQMFFMRDRGAVQSIKEAKA